MSFHKRNNIEIGKRRFHHDDIRPFLDIEIDFLEGLDGVGGRHLVALPVACLWRRFGRLAEWAVE